MIKKIRWFLKNFDAIVALVEKNKVATDKRFSILGVPEEQRKYIQKEFITEEKNKAVAKMIKQEVDYE